MARTEGNGQKLAKWSKIVKKKNYKQQSLGRGGQVTRNTYILFYQPKTQEYRIYLAIRRGFHLSRMTTNNLISCM